MIINFNKKVRKIAIFILIAMFIIGTLLALNYKNILETLKTAETKVLDQYSIDLIFNDETKRLMCNQKVDYVNNTKTTIDKVYFHIYPNAFSKKQYAPFEKNEMKRAYPNGFNEGYINIKNVLSNEKVLTYNIKGDKEDILEIKLGKSLKPNEKVSIDLKYNVKLPNSLGRFGYGENTINVTNWFPIACVYDERGWNIKSYETVGDPFYSETSNFKITMLLPRKYKLATTGKVLSEKKDSEQAMYNIEAKNVRDFAFILSEKFDIKTASVKNTLITTYTLNKDMSDLATEVAKDSLSIFNKIFGQYPYDNFSIVASDFFIGGMEYPMLIMIDKSLYTDKNKFFMEYVIAHETAHQWWYSVIGNDEISEPWIDEALTEYSTVLYFEKKYGKEVGEKLINSMDLQSKNYKCEDIFKASDQYKNSTDYSLNVYTKGAVIFNEIRKQVGDKLFFETLQEYYNTYKYENVNGAKFVDLWNKKGIDIEKIISKEK